MQLHLGQCKTTNANEFEDKGLTLFVVLLSGQTSELLINMKSMDALASGHRYSEIWESAWMRGKIFIFSHISHGSSKIECIGLIIEFTCAVYFDVQHNYARSSYILDR